MLKQSFKSFGGLVGGGILISLPLESVHSPQSTAPLYRGYMMVCQTQGPSFFKGGTCRRQVPQKGHHILRVGKILHHFETMVEAVPC